MDPFPVNCFATPYMPVPGLRETDRFEAWCRLRMGGDISALLAESGIGIPIWDR